MVNLKAVIRKHPLKAAAVAQSIVIAVAALYLWLTYTLYAPMLVLLAVLMFTASATFTTGFHAVLTRTAARHRKQLAKQQVQIKDLQIKTERHSDAISITLTIALSALNPSEQTVVQRLMKSKSVKQDLLRRELGWSRSKTSEVVKGLELKNLLTKKPHGKTNILELKSQKEQFKGR